jgi:hypothetical protein
MAQHQFFDIFPTSRPGVYELIYYDQRNRREIVIFSGPKTVVEEVVEEMAEEIRVLARAIGRIR